MSGENKNYLMPLIFLEKLVEDCERDLKVSLINVQHFSTQEIINEKLLGLLCESYCLSVRIKEEAFYHSTEGLRSENTQEVTEVTIPVEKVMVLQALVIAKKEVSRILTANPGISVWEN